MINKRNDHLEKLMHKLAKIRRKRFLLLGNSRGSYPFTMQFNILMLAGHSAKSIKFSRSQQVSASTLTLLSVSFGNNLQSRVTGCRNSSPNMFLMLESL